MTLLRSEFCSKHFLLLRISGLILGLIFFVSGAAKAVDFNQFVRQIQAYGFSFDVFVLMPAAWGLIVLEGFLGAAFLVNWRIKAASSIAVGLMLLFVALTAWATFAGGPEDCGCFGSLLKRTPRQALIEDILITLVAGMVWYQARRNGSTSARGPWRKWMVAAVCMIAAVLPVLTNGVNPFTNASKAAGNPLKGLSELDLEGVAIDRDRVMLVLMSTDCEHCQNAVPSLNEMLDRGWVDQVVALTVNDSGERDTFEAVFEPLYPVRQIDSETFWRLLQTHRLPYFVLLENGRLLNSWDGGLEDPEALL